MGKKKIFQGRLTTIVVFCALSVVFIKVSLNSPSVSYKFRQPSPTIQSKTLTGDKFVKNVYQRRFSVAHSTSKIDVRTASEKSRVESVETELSTRTSQHTDSETSLSYGNSTQSISAFTTALPINHLLRENARSLFNGSSSSLLSNITNKTDFGRHHIIHPNYQDYVNIIQKKVVPVDLMKEGPFDFLPNYRNPCWKQTVVVKGDPPIQCLPYFYMIGAPKAGTTDLFMKLVKHPQISRYAVKEPHWLTRKRFYMSDRVPAQPKFTSYLKYFRSAAKHIFAIKDKSNFHPVVVGDCSASTMWDNQYWNILPEFRNLSEPLYTNADYIHHLNPNTKFIAMLRNPIDRLYSDYLYFKRGPKSPALFHKEVKVSIDLVNECLKSYSLRECANRPVITEESKDIRIYIGVYHQHLKEFYRVFPAEQVLVIKLEDYSRYPEAYLTKIFDFLGVNPLPSDKLAKIGTSFKRANTRRTHDVTVGDMLPETRLLLQDFYKYHNDELGSLLGEQFNYNIDEELRNLS